MDDLAPPYETPNAQLYQPLSHPDSIRVLTVFECDSEDDDIECHLAETRLSDSNDEGEGYTAISYAWGDIKFTHEIWLGDQRLLIGANLAAALRHLRRRDTPIRLWVDAVCINQGDITEKNHQVQQMRNIFSAASETIIWLGPAGGNTSVAAWNLLERHSSWALNDRRERDHTLPAKLEEDLLSFRGEFRDVEIDVLSRPWFKRLWVFQEAVLSRTLSIQCGYRRISWDDFSKTVLQSERHHDRNDQVLFQQSIDADDEEDKSFILVMALWARKLTSTNHGFDAKADMDFINRARSNGVPWEELPRADEDDPNFPEGFLGSNDLRGLRLHLKQARIHDPNLMVQAHLYRRGQVAANWSGPNIDRDIPRFTTSITDDESIVDGRSLAVCVNETKTHTDDPDQAAGQLALVPGAAKEGDVIIQISGARVPFVLRRRANDWSDFAGTRNVASPTQKGHTKAMKSWVFPWELIGDCVLNGFEELPEDAMDTRFRLV
ncbi:hypothetical protein FJTKL_01210 [Diaporthe vaccinii]|uniref:Heterokaryon incompatibility domain-containing protein n=1 Tax=Diaporthe vaccinii TaxID=105482 RepID=A0ABR4F607_9PEZI